MKGYQGKVLYYDLTLLQAEVQNLDQEQARNYIGGSGMGAKILYEETNGDTEPLGPENVLIFMTGPFTATPVLCSSRYSVVSKSPLTGIFAESNSGGTWAQMLKRAGFDGLVIKGRAPKPVYLWISNGEIKLGDAQHLWGKDTFETDSMVKSETHPKAVVASIGQAGERCVPLASIMNDGVHARTAGRCGLGAVMGSKNLKAIVVYGEKPVAVSDPKGLRDSIQTVSKEVRANAKELGQLGTAGALPLFDEIGSLPLQNWRYTERWKQGAQRLSGNTLVTSYATGNYACGRCIIGCGKTVQIKDGPYRGEEHAGPEYETLALLGSSCLIDDMEAIIRANDLCNRYGLDTIGTGSAIAFGMEAFEKGFISEGDTGGIELTWGNAEAMVQMVEMIGESTGIGRILGLGSRGAARAWGKRSEEFAMHVKGLDLPAHDPRAYNAGGVSFATSNRGACHLAGFSHTFERALAAPEIDIPDPVDRFEVSGKGILAAKTQNYMGMMDAMEICKFILFGGVGMATLINWYVLVTGEHMDIDGFMKTGERIFNIKRLYNVECGISRKDDFLPARMLTWNKTGEGLPSNLPPLGSMLGEYYKYRGWSEDGIPTKEKLEELGLSKHQ